MNFSFNTFDTIGEVRTTVGKPSLKPYTITKVKLNSIELIKGKDKNGKEYSYIKTVFESEKEEQFTHNEFIPDNNEKSKERGKFKDTVYPSSEEKFAAFIKILISVIYPESMEKIIEYMKNKTSKNEKVTYEDFAKLAIKALETKVNSVEFDLKLVHNLNKGTVYTSLPYFCIIDKNSNLPCPIAFIGDGLSFSNSEKRNMIDYNSGQLFKRLEEIEKFKKEETEMFKTNQIDVNDDLENFTELPF